MSLKKSVYRILFCTLYKATGIDERNICRLRILSENPTILGEAAR
jgi:hypothetical protein